MHWLKVEPTDEQVEAAAEALMSWQFPGRNWDDAVPALREKFIEGARKSLTAAASVTLASSVRGCA